MSFGIGLGIGLGIRFVLGWIVFKHPDWATTAINWVKSKIGLG